MISKKTEYVSSKERVRLSSGDAVRISCEMMNISQAELARRSGVPESHISAMIKGARPIGKTVAEKLAKVLNISPAVILFPDENLRKGSNTNNDIDTSLLERAIQTVEENKNKDTHTQLDAMRAAIEFIARAILPNNRVQPVLVRAKYHRSISTKRSH